MNFFCPCQKFAYISRSVGEVVKFQLLYVVADEFCSFLWLVLQLENVFHDDLQIL